MALPEEHTSPREIQYIIHKYSTKKAPGHDLISKLIVKNLFNNSNILLILNFNYILRLFYFATAWKNSNIILIPKPDKSLNMPSSYRTIFLLPILTKIFEGNTLQKTIITIRYTIIIHNHQFGYWSKHTIIHQFHHTADLISTSIKSKLYSEAVLLDVAQTFDRVWYNKLFFKLEKFLTAPYYP